MPTVINHTSRLDSMMFVHELFKAIESSDENIDVSIILDGEEAECLHDMLTNSNRLVVKNFLDFENEFAEMSGKCLLSVFKIGNTVEVIAEDVYVFKDEGYVAKYHEANTLVVAKHDIDIVRDYDIEKCIVINFEHENENIKALLFE